MIELLFLIFGILFGILSGIFPGIHVNTLATFLSSLDAEPIILSFILVGASVAHQLFEFLPAMFLCIPNSSTVASILPGHKLVLQGKAFLALNFVALSCLFATIFSILLCPIVILFAAQIYPLLQSNMLYVLIFASVFLILSEKSLIKSLLALFIFLLSGFLGLLILNFPLSTNPLLAGFTGLFGFSAALIALHSIPTLPKQEDIEKPFKPYIKYAFLGSILGIIVGFLPGLGPAQAAVFALAFLAPDSLGFLCIVAGISISNIVYSFVALFTINKARTGVAVALKSITGGVSSELLISLLAALLVAVGLSIFIFTIISPHIAKTINKISPKKLSFAILGIGFSAVLLFSGIIGLLISLVACAIGILPPLIGIRRSHAMGVIMVPTIFYFAGLSSWFITIVLYS